MAKLDNKDVLEGIDKFSCIVSWKKIVLLSRQFVAALQRLRAAASQVATNTKTTKGANHRRLH